VVRFRYGLSSCSLPWTDLTGASPATGGFYSQASNGSVTLAVAKDTFRDNPTCGLSCGNQMDSAVDVDEYRTAAIVAVRLQKTFGIEISRKV
jgi:hypothetical protein